MTCNEALVEYLSLDNGQDFSPALTAHLAGCGGCRGEVDAMQMAFAAMSADQPRPAEDLAVRVLERVRDLESGHAQRIPFQTWIAAGLFLMFGLLAIPSSRELAGLRMIFGGSFELVLCLALGLFLSVYATVFIGLNLKAIIRRTGFKPRPAAAANQ